VIRIKYGAGIQTVEYAGSEAGVPERQQNPRMELWRLKLPRLANATGLIVEVRHFPPDASRWGKIEHRQICHITRNLQGVPLETLEIVVDSITNTCRETGLEPHTRLDENPFKENCRSLMKNSRKPTSSVISSTVTGLMNSNLSLNSSLDS
jgi:hypothetical protein